MTAMEVSDLELVIISEFNVLQRRRENGKVMKGAIHTDRMREIAVCTDVSLDCFPISELKPLIFLFKQGHSVFRCDCRRRGLNDSFITFFYHIIF